ncbi:MAG: sulfotransferase [Puniceicoccaceae bacterium]
MPLGLGRESVRLRKKGPILVTGSHRSGTTWMGSILAESSEVSFVHEPFNPTVSVDGVGCPWDLWFQGADQSSKKLINRHLNGVLERRRGFRVLLKDPIAVFAARYLHRRFSAKVVAMIRHPAAFVGSLKLKGWRHDFGHFVAQPHLMKRFCRRDRALIRAYAATQPELIDEAILLWRLIYREVARWKDSRWCLPVYHEELSQDPVGEFRRVFLWLGLDFDEKIKEKIRVLSEGSQREDPDGGFGLDDLQRNSQANLKSWRWHLSDEEISKVRSEVGDLDDFLYEKRAW